MIHQALFIAETSAKGRGMFTRTFIPEGTIIEVSPVIVRTADERKLLDQTLLHDYIFEWQPDGKKMCCMAQGYISVYNHSQHSNCEHYMDYEQQTMSIKTIRDIEADEELTINYNGDWDNEEPVWFPTKED